MPRKTYLLIQTPKGERMLVKSLAGHEGSKVISRRVPEPLSPHHRLSPKGKWVEDSAAAERVRLDQMNRSELLNEIEKLIKRGGSSV